MGRRVPQIDDDSIREIIFYNYRIMYKLERHENIVILAIIHAARDINNISPHPWEVT